jgi:hypothetical protein
MGYPGGHHTSHLSLGNTQQLYDMMLPGPPHETHPAVARVQQQHNVFRGTHHHSASDPSAMRDAATLAMLSSNMQAFIPPAPGMFPPAMTQGALSLHASQFYGAQDAYPRPDVAAAQAMAARLQAQYSGPYGAVQGQGMGVDSGLPSPGGGSSQNGPSANNRKLGLYKTELCRSWEEKNTCRYGAKCQFAHGEDEIRKVSRHPKVDHRISPHNSPTDLFCVISTRQRFAGYAAVPCFPTYLLTIPWFRHSGYLVHAPTVRGVVSYTLSCQRRGHLELRLVGLTVHPLRPGLMAVFVLRAPTATLTTSLRLSSLESRPNERVRTTALHPLMSVPLSTASSSTLAHLRAH